MREAIETTYQNLFEIKGRVTRKQYWSTWLFNIVIVIISLFLSEFLYGVAGFVYFVVTIITAIKRCHDVGYAGFYILIPLFNFIILISNSDENENKWGPPVESS
tara:strand:- start:214 stop:525 length:312 start_codon:yes stop_codon:yes gene_type:complete